MIRAPFRKGVSAIPYCSSLMKDSTVPCAAQTLEKVPGTHLINQILKRRAAKTRGRMDPKGLSGWAKAQMMMIDAIEHDEMWCHKGFLQVVLVLGADVALHNGGKIHLISSRIWSRRTMQSGT